MSTIQKRTTPLGDALRIFLRNKPAVAAAVMIFLLATAAVTGSLLTGKQADSNELIRFEESELLGDRYKTEAIKYAALDPIKTELKDTFLSPGSKSNAADKPDKVYYLGTDNLGRDVLARLWSGSTISLTIGFLAVGISVFLGIVLGGIAGYFGRSRVGLPVLATLLLMMIWGILLAAGLPVIAWVCFALGMASFVFQLAVAALGRRFQPVGFFLAAVALTAGFSAYNRNIETTTPEGMTFQAASQTYTKSYDLLLHLRQYGETVKAFEDESQDHRKQINDSGKTANEVARANNGKQHEPLPAWIFAGQLDIEVRFKLLEMQVARFDVAKDRGSLLEALRLAVEQQQRADHLESFQQDYADKNRDALADEKRLGEQRDAMFKAGNRDEGRKLAEESSAAGARAKTFDPAELVKRLTRLRQLGLARQAYVERVLDGSESLFEERLGAITACEESLNAVLSDSAENFDTLRQRQFTVELALRELRVAQARVKLADAALRAETAASVLGLDHSAHSKAVDKYLESAAKALKAVAEFKFDSSKDLEAEVKRLGELMDSATAPTDALKIAASEWAKATSESKKLENAGLAEVLAELTVNTGAIAKCAQEWKDARKGYADVLTLVASTEAVGKLKDVGAAQTRTVELERQLAPIKVQGSNDLIDRRGKLRKAFVIKYDTEVRNGRTAMQVAENLNGTYRYGMYRFTSHFLTTTVLVLLLIVGMMVVMAAGQSVVNDRMASLKVVYLPTISVDDLVMRFTEIVMTIPVLFLILAILAVFEKDVYITMGVIGLTSWMGTTRFVRAEILSLREQDFVQAARSLGLSDFRIIWRHLVPNAISPVLVSASIGVAGAVLAESTLSFLGIGAKQDQTTWGMILSQGREYIFDASWLTWIPGVAILFTVLAFNLLGEGLREAFNPKLRGR